jgi:hypothetical protein
LSSACISGAFGAGKRVTLAGGPFEGTSKEIPRNLRKRVQKESWAGGVGLHFIGVYSDIWSVRIFVFFISFFLCFSAFAEYRVYKLKITNMKTEKSREIFSTLMPREYLLYYSVASFEKIEIVDHWMCWKRSDGFKPLCSRPTASLAEGQKTGSPQTENPVLSP